MILAFETATDRLTIALGTTDNIIAETNEDAPRAHLNRLIPAIDRMIKESGIPLADIDYIAVGIGPGSFTGLRIAVSTAQGLAHALDRPLIGVSTMDAIAVGVSVALGESAESDTLIYPIMDAKRREVYTAGYDRSGLRFTDYQVLKPQLLAENLSVLDKPVLIAGDGLAQYAPAFDRNSYGNIISADRSLWPPRASVLIRLAEDKIYKEEVEPYYKVLPMYIRLPDAIIRPKTT